MSLINTLIHKELTCLDIKCGVVSVVGDPKPLALDSRDLVEFVSWILDVERGDRTWSRSRYHYAARGNSQMLKVMKDYVIPKHISNVHHCIFGSRTQS